MKILVTEMPETVERCLFSQPRLYKGSVIHTCMLRPYIEDEETERDHHKPLCLCKHVESCKCLEVLK